MKITGYNCNTKGSDSVASVYDIANAFIEKEPMSPKKIQKLSYYFYAWGLTLYHKKMINDSKFQAWVHGPVSYKLYTKYKKYGWADVKEYEEYNLNCEEKRVLEAVWDTYGDLSPDELEALTHSEEPWIKARRGLGEYENSDKSISDDDIKEYYASIYIGD